MCIKEGREAEITKALGRDEMWCVWNELCMFLLDMSGDADV